MSVMLFRLETPLASRGVPFRRGDINAKANKSEKADEPEDIKLYEKAE